MNPKARCAAFEHILCVAVVQPAVSAGKADSLENATSFFLQKIMGYLGKDFFFLNVKQKELV